MYLSNNTKYNNFTQGYSIYATGQPLLFAVSVNSTNEKPSFCTIYSNTVTVSNLEMLRVKDGSNVIDLIDIAPFVRSMFDTDEEPYSSSTTGKIVFATVQATNEGEINEVSVRSAFLKQSVGRGEDPVIARAPLATQAEGMREGIYEADMALNDFSPIYVPSGRNAKIIANVFSVLTDENIAVAKRNFNITDTTSFVTVTKTGATSQLELGVRPVVHRPYCEGRSLVVQYLNRRNYFEYFIFDSWSTTEYEIEKAIRVSNGVSTINSNKLGQIYGISTAKKITASVNLTDEAYAAKFLELCTSRKVYIYKGYGSETSNESWLEVDLASSPVLGAKSKRNTVEITIKEDRAW